MDRRPDSCQLSGSHCWCDEVGHITEVAMATVEVNLASPYQSLAKTEPNSFTQLKIHIFIIIFNEQTNVRNTMIRTEQKVENL